MTLREFALSAHHLGLCVVPPKEDGSKQPDANWKDYQERLSTEQEILRWYSGDRSGIGLICGRTSGNLEMLEFEGRAVGSGLHHRYRELAEQAGLGELLTRLLNGCSEETPSAGIHLIYRCTEPVSGNLKLARRPATEEELEQNPEDRIKVLIETRGEGGYVVTAPSNGRVHPSGGAYRFLRGGFESIITISPEEREALLDLARSFDEMPRPPSEQGPVPVPSERPSQVDEVRPGEDFEAKASWSEILEPHGWRRLFTTRNGNEHWQRPGKKIGTSATINEYGKGVLYVFSSSTPFTDERAYSKFGAYGVLEHRGDFKAAASALRQRGYGSTPASATASTSPNGEAPQAEPQPIETVQPPWPAPLGEDAYHGLVGRLVAFIAPYVESDEAATLAQFLTAFGVAAGQQPYFAVGATRQAPTTYLGLVGRTSRARKGTSWDPIRTLFRGSEPEFSERVMSGLGSGERLVYLVRDPSYSKEGVETDPGATDRRLLLQEPELARLLTIVNREGSTLSAYLRAAYDGQALRNEVKTNGAVASTHHIGLIGHCTSEDLVGQLKEQEIRNGLANRILWVLARRDKRLPDPPVFEGPAVEEACSELRWALSQARQVGRMRRHAAAQRLWNDWYLALPDDETGILGAITNRAEAQVIRFSMIYALTDGAELIGVDHLKAAIALWEFSTRCAAHIFGSSTGNLAADRILEELARGPLLKTEVHELFNRNLSARDLLEAQRILERRGLLIRVSLPSTGGRPPEQWRKRA